jgi:hypothetical protein
MLDLQIDITPVDCVSRSIVDISQQAQSSAGIFQLVNPEPVHWHDLAAWLTSSIPELEQTTPENTLPETIDLLKSLLVSHLPLLENEHQPPSLPRQRANGVGGPSSAQNTSARLADASIVGCAGWQQVFERYTAQLADRGLIPAGGSAALFSQATSRD